MPLHISDIHVSYGKHEVLRGVTARPLEDGTVTGLLGPNAAGKSTLVKTLAGKRELRDVVGYVPQDLLTSASLTAFESVLVSTKRAHGLRTRAARSSESSTTRMRSPCARLVDTKTDSNAVRDALVSRSCGT